MTVVELSFRKGRVQTVSIRALCMQIYTARAYAAFFSGSKGHYNIINWPCLAICIHLQALYISIFFMLKVLRF